MSEFTPTLLWSRPEGPSLASLLLAHGAGAGQDSSFLTRLTEALVARGIAVARFEFGYMAARRDGGKKRPPPKAEALVPEYRAAIDLFLAEVPTGQPVAIGGKSMGGRVAVLAAGGELPDTIGAVIVFGYPFHPQGKPEDWRMEPLMAARRPVLICQGERDEFGSSTELADRVLPETVRLEWIEDGSHDFGPRGSSPATLKGNIVAAAAHARALLVPEA